MTVADGGEAGIRALERPAFDVMPVDLFMPHMDSFDDRTWHKRAPAILLIATSGYTFAGVDTPSPDFRRMPLELSATPCLRKPFAPNALLAAGNEYLEKSIASARLSS